MRTAVLILATLLTLTTVLTAGPIGGYTQTNLVSDIPGLAANTDPDLVNAWGISFNPTSPFWISDNGNGIATLYNAAGAKQSLIVTIPSPTGGTSAPTGQVFSGTSAFNGDLFIFATEDGTIDGWRNALGTTAEVLVDATSSSAVFKGLALGTIGGNSYLYASDFHNNMITVDPSAGAPPLTGTFTDPNLPAGFAPFNVQVLNNQLYVTYAKQLPGGMDDDPGPGNGFVDVYTLNGDLVGRLISNGVLNSPWGLAIAPAGFGALAGDLLVGNFGDGTINAFTTSGTFVGTLADLSNTPIMNDGLWALTFGNNGAGSRPGSLYLTAGLNGEMDGLFARIDPAPEPATLGTIALGMGALYLAFRRRRKA